MAVVWAKGNGNWSSSSLWAFWNENTQQIEDYGQTPQGNDVVFANGYNVHLNVQVITCSILTNRMNGYTNRQDGYFDTTSLFRVFNCNMEVGSTYLVNFNTTSDVTMTMTGNIEGCNLYTGNTDNCVFYKGSSNRNEIIITGNINGYNGNAIFGGGATRLIPFTVNGNVVITYHLTAGLSIDFANTINGNFTKQTSGDFQIGGTYGDNCGLAVSGYVLGDLSFDSIKATISIGVGYYYTDKFHLPLDKLVINNPQTFIFQYVGTQPNPNEYFVVNKYTFNQTYPAENKVISGTIYGSQNEFVGNYTVDYPPESVVLNGYEYDNGNKTGNMSASAQVGCVTKEDVREGVSLIGMGEVGTLVVPSVDDVREGVIFDNGSVGTLIVQGGGDRLRIADFGYYTRSTSITYIVDLTESDKPAFADCEEIVLRSLFPTLDLDNIPDKFFDDLFVQFLRYRLLVEYYRGTSINSKFTPSEPTTEIVNYANTKCEYWLNTANLFLQLWGEKYPNSVKKDRILL